MAADEPLVIMEFFMQLESPPLPASPLAEHRTPHQLPTGQVLRTHLIAGDRILGTGSSRLWS